MERKMVVWIWISAKIAMYSAPHSGNKRCSPTLKEKGLKTAPVGMWFPVQKKKQIQGFGTFLPNPQRSQNRTFSENKIVSCPWGASLTWPVLG